MNFYYYICIILISLFCLFFKKLKEGFSTDKIKYHPVTGNSFQDDRFQKYNQNNDKKWKELPSASNEPIIQTYGTSFNDMYKMNQYIFNDFTKVEIDKFIKKYSNPNINVSKNNRKLYTPFDINNINKESWDDKFNWNPDNVLYQKYTESKFKEVNNINNNFLKMFNTYWFNFIDNYVKRNVLIEKPYFILKYRIVNIYENNFEIVTVITRDDAKLAFEFFIQGDGKSSEINIQYMSNYSLDQLLIRKNIDKTNDIYYNLNPLWANDTTIPSSDINSIKIKEEEKQKNDRDFLDTTNVCFTYDKLSDEPISVPIYALDRNDCENKYNIIGYKKESGIWDSPCNKNDDCPFYKQNKNYKNDHGKCINEKCQLPLNMKNLGYHYYINEKTVKPVCYNCNTTSDKWLPYTFIDFCCDEQNDRKKYPHLNGPDYAFENDINIRKNEFNQKYCKMKKNYSNIFTDSNVWNIECNGDYYNSYFLGKS